MQVHYYLLFLLGHYSLIAVTSLTLSECLICIKFILRVRDIRVIDKSCFSNVDIMSHMTETALKVNCLIPVTQSLTEIRIVLSYSCVFFFQRKPTFFLLLVTIYRIYHICSFNPFKDVYVKCNNYILYLKIYNYFWKIFITERVLKFIRSEHMQLDFFVRITTRKKVGRKDDCPHPLFNLVTTHFKHFLSSSTPKVSNGPFQRTKQSIQVWPSML